LSTPFSINVVHWVGVPSSSMFSEPRRRASVPSSTNGAELRGHLLADATREGRGALAIEVALQAVADRLVQQDAGPARAEYHGHRARRAPGWLEIHQAWRTASRASASGLIATHQLGQRDAPARASA
jgi:hypothetical protein